MHSTTNKILNQNNQASSPFVEGLNQIDFTIENRRQGVISLDQLGLCQQKGCE